MPDLMELLGRDVEQLSPMPPIQPILICDTDELAKVMPVLGGSDYVVWPTGDLGAVTWMVDDHVGMSMDVRRLMGNGAERAELVAAIAHEATHMAIRHLKSIGEEQPAEEELAYHVENMVLVLMEQFEDWMADNPSEK